MFIYRSVCLLFLLNTYCSAEYLKFYIEDYCHDNVEENSGEYMVSSNTSVMLYSTRSGHQLSNKTCGVKLVAPDTSDGLIVTVLNISIVDPNQKCEDYLRFDASEVAKWCNSSSAQSLVFPRTNVVVEYTIGPNSTSMFVLAITPFQKPSLKDQSCPTNSSFKCDDSAEQQCIYKDFHCDGIANCPTGNDEHDCRPLPDYEVEEDDELSDYSELYISDYCNAGIAEFPFSFAANETTAPAIVRARRNGRRLSNETCSLRFQFPTNKWYVKYGLIVTVENMAIGNASKASCDDYIEFLLDEKEAIKWCNDSHEKGLEFDGQDYLDITLHAGLDSDTDFTFIVTPFRKRWPVAGCWNRFHCDGTEECVPQVFRCDGYLNCINGADEDGCPGTQNITTVTTPITTSITPTTAPLTTTTTPTPPTTSKPTTSTAPTPTTTGTPNTTTTEPTTPHTTNGTTTAKPSSTTIKPSPKPFPRGAIIGIVVGVVALLVLVVIGSVYIIRRRRQNAGYAPLND